MNRASHDATHKLKSSSCVLSGRVSTATQAVLSTCRSKRAAKGQRQRNACRNKRTASHFNVLFSTVSQVLAGISLLLLQLPQPAGAHARALQECHLAPSVVATDSPREELPGLTRVLCAGLRVCDNPDLDVDALVRVAPGPAVRWRDAWASRSLTSLMWDSTVISVGMKLMTVMVLLWLMSSLGCREASSLLSSTDLGLSPDVLLPLRRCPATSAQVARLSHGDGPLGIVRPGRAHPSDACLRHARFGHARLSGRCPGDGPCGGPDHCPFLGPDLAQPPTGTESHSRRRRVSCCSPP